MYLEKHTQSHLKSETNFQCTICEKDFSKKVDLVNHIMNIHENGKSSECPICFKQFSWVYLPRHISQIHEKKAVHNEHKCNLCEKTFSDLMCLANHEMAIHAAIKSSCDICNKPLRKDSLKHHKKIFLSGRIKEEPLRM